MRRASIVTQGKMSQAIAQLDEGQEMLMRGPKGRLAYKPNMKKHIGETSLVVG
jgi:NAD(P)H-flavin reductase